MQDAGSILAAYAPDLTDGEWRCLTSLLPASKTGGRPRIHNLRAVLATIFYVLRSGCPWRLLPRDFPSWKIVYQYFRAWRIDGTFEQLNSALREGLRIPLGRNAHPSAAIADSQSAKTTGVGGEQRKGLRRRRVKVRGRKRHILVDTEGLVLKAKVHNARLLSRRRDRVVLLESARTGHSRLKQLWLDAS